MLGLRGPWGKGLCVCAHEDDMQDKAATLAGAGRVIWGKFRVQEGGAGKRMCSLELASLDLT